VIPSPSQAVWHLGPIPLRAYALCILAGIAVAVWVGERRWRARGGRPGVVADVAVWAVPFGVAGGRIYHVLTSPDAYFGPGGDPWRAFQIWQGGLGIWGAVALGAVGAWIGCRRVGVRLSSFVDAAAPGVLLAQAVGRFGNWFNQELFGRPTDLPWGLRIDPEHRPEGYEDSETFHPTFAYEALWNVAGATLLVWADRRFRLGRGRVFWLYVVVYTLGRLWIEALRIDPAERVLGLRLNIWTSLLVGLLGAVAFVVSARRAPGREADVHLPGRSPAQHAAGEHAPGEQAAGEQAAGEQVRGEQHEEEPQVPAGEADEGEDPPAHPQRAREQADGRERR
jgi:prolipoprotein diacylglyceryl transferase